VPAVAVVSAKALYGLLVEPVTFGFVSPVRAATTSDPHEFDDKITRTAFVAADSVVVHVSTKLQLIVSVQSVVWSSGPCKMNIPTVKLYFVTSPPGE
jgi:hypothetical protein